MTKSSRKVLILCLAAILALGALVYLTNGFQNFEKDYISGQIHRVNPDNLYTAECMTLTDTNDGTGVSIKVKANGAFVLNGTATDDVTATIGTVTLPAGTYTFTACDSSSNSTLLVEAYKGSGASTKVATADLTGSGTSNKTFTLSEQTTLTLKISYFDDAVFKHIEVAPCIVEGDKAADFYK